MPNFCPETTYSECHFSLKSQLAESNGRMARYHWCHLSNRELGQKGIGLKSHSPKVIFGHFFCPIRILLRVIVLFYKFFCGAHIFGANVPKYSNCYSCGIDIIVVISLVAMSWSQKCRQLLKYIDL